MTSPQTCGVTDGFLIGIPQIIEGCGTTGQDIAACTQPLNTVYSFTTTDTGYVVGTPARDITNVPNADWSFTLVSDGWYTVSYKGVRVRALLTQTGGRLTTSTGQGLYGDITISQTQGTSATDVVGRSMFVRVVGNYLAENRAGLMVFAPGGSTTTATYVLGAQLVSLSGQTSLIPILLSTTTVETTDPGLPGGTALVTYIPGSVTTTSTGNGFPVVFRMPRTCQEQDPLGKKMREQEAAETSTRWTWIIGGLLAFIVLLVVGYFIVRAVKPPAPQPDIATQLAYTKLLSY